MYTNTKCITVFHKGIDREKRLPVWERHIFHDVYWENVSAMDNSKITRAMTEDNSILCIIPANSLGDFIPCKDDIIARGDAENRENGFTIMAVKNFLYGSESVQHIEVNAK